ncbi:MAG: hypothetical protein ACR2GZ_04055 [Solirubrobacteraceae bacterium]
MAEAQLGQDRPSAALVAAQAAERSPELEPDQAGPHLAIGRVALAAGSDTDATSAFCAALGVDPLCVEAHSELSVLQSRVDRSARSWRPVLGLRRRRARDTARP